MLHTDLLNSNSECSKFCLGIGYETCLKLVVFYNYIQINIVGSMNIKKFKTRKSGFEDSDSSKVVQTVSSIVQ